MACYEQVRFPVDNIIDQTNMKKKKKAKNGKLPNSFFRMVQKDGYLKREKPGK